MWLEHDEIMNSLMNKMNKMKMNDETEFQKKMKNELKFHSFHYEIHSFGNP